MYFSVLDADLTKVQLVGLLRKFPKEECDLNPLIASAYFSVKRIDEDLSFENFWEQYGQKIHPHRCEPIWKKMSDVKKLAALKGIASYDAYLNRKGIAKANPEKYLKWEYWKTNWSKEL